MRVDDERWMKRALSLAAKARRLSPPNPSVGAVIVREGTILGEGYTQETGGPHAEVMALRDAKAKGHDVAGATIYVTLEPCSHYGRTPPCALAIAEAGLARVVSALEDPNPLVAGRGLRMLEEAGIAVESGLLREEALEMNRGFVTRMTTGRPYVRLKCAATLDGRTALPDGRSFWITGEAARLDAQYWRAVSGAVVTGIGTVIADNPKMTVRLKDQVRFPLRVVIDPRMETPPGSEILKGGETVIVAAVEDASRRAALEAAGARIWLLPDGNVSGYVDLVRLLEELGKLQVNEIHLEAGARINGAFLREDLVDEIVLYEAPCFFGEGLPIAALPVAKTPGGAKRWRIVQAVTVGDDLRLRLRRKD